MDLSIEEIRAQVKSLRSGRPLNDSGKRHYEKHYEEGQYTIRVTDPVLKRWVGDIHPYSFIDLAIEWLNETDG
jgi:hypothetical protein